MADAYYLTQKDRDILDKLSNMFFGQPTPNGPYDPEPRIPESSDIYIALVPEDGIPAATANDGESTPDLTVDDKPGSANCKIFRVIDGELKYCGMEKRIYNISSTDIAEGWISVKRDKYGTWLADNPGGNFLQGFLKTSLAAPADPIGPPTTAEMDVYHPVDGVLEYVETIEVKNYDTALAGEPGTYCKSEIVNGERQIYWMSCEPGYLGELLDTDGTAILDSDGTPIIISL